MNGPVLLTCLIKRGGGGWLHSDDDNYEKPHRHKLFLEMLCSSGRYTVKLDEVESVPRMLIHMSNQFWTDSD